MKITKIEKDGETIKVNVDVVPDTLVYNIKYIKSKDHLIEEINNSIKIINEFKSQEELDMDKYNTFIKNMVGDTIA